MKPATSVRWPKYVYVHVDNAQLFCVFDLCCVEPARSASRTKLGRSPGSNQFLATMILPSESWLDVLAFLSRFDIDSVEAVS